MNKVPDRKQQRRKYLTKRAVLTLASLLTGCDVFLLLVSLHFFTGIVQFVAMAIGAIAVFTRLYKEISYFSFKQQLDLMPYVPPVTADTLPVEEVLLRGTAEPSAGCETLLRATPTAQETQAEELLRSSGAGTEK